MLHPFPWEMLVIIMFDIHALKLNRELSECMQMNENEFNGYHFALTSG